MLKQVVAVKDPHLLLPLHGDGSTSHIHTMHAHTVAAGGRDALEDYFSTLKQRGEDSCYLVGAFRSSPLSGLMMQLFCQEWEKPTKPELVGPSVFSIFAYDFTNRKFTGMGGLEDVVGIAKQNGIQVILDWIPHSIALDSMVAMHNPEFILDYKGKHPSWEEFEGIIASRPKTFNSQSNFVLNAEEYQCNLDVYKEGMDEVFHYKLQTNHIEFELFIRRDTPEKTDSQGFLPYGLYQITRNGHTKTYCKTIGHEDGKTWGDVWRLDFRSTHVQAWQKEVLEQIAKISGGNVRIDMAHIPEDEYWESFLGQFDGSDLSALNLIGEAYHGQHGRLAQHGIKPYASFIREWLESEQISKLKEHLFGEEAGFYRDADLVLSIANHDDDLWSNRLKVGAAMAIGVSCPVRSILTGQGQGGGVDYRFGADARVPWEQFLHMRGEAIDRDPGYHAFMDKLRPLVASPVYRSPESEFWEPHISDFGGRPPENVFAIARHLQIEDQSHRVFTVVNYQEGFGTYRLAVDLTKTFVLSGEDLSSYSIVDLITGDAEPAVPIFFLPFKKEAFTSHLYALVPTANIS